MNRSTLVTLIGIALFIAFSIDTAKGCGAATQKDELKLGINQPVERQIKSGELHRYCVQGEAGNVLDVVVDQRGVDVVVDVLAPDGKKILELDSPNGSDGPEAVLLLAEAAGAYTVQVRVLEQDVSGRYTITFNGSRAPTKQDLKHFEDLAKLAEAQRIENQWWRLYNTGRYAEAIPMAERVLEIRESVLGPNHPDVAVTINSLALLFQNTSDYAKAESLFRRSLAIDEGVFGKDHPNLAITYGNLATLYYDIGDYVQAEALMRKALALREKSFTRQHADVALSLHNLARLYEAKGDLVGTEEFCREALDIYQKVRPPDHPDIARALTTLAELYRQRGDFSHAEPLYLQALAIYQKWGDKGEFWAAATESNLATMHVELGNYDKAEQLFNLAIAAYEKSVGKEHPDLIQVLNNLAVLCDDKGEYDRAEALHQRSLAIRRKLFGPESSQYAESLNNLAQVYWHRHDFERARSLVEQAITIWEKTLGRDHPHLARAYSNLALQQTERKDIANAVKTLKRINEIEEHNLKLILTTGSEDQKRIYLKSIAGNAEFTVSLSVREAPNNEEAARLALTLILQRKGRALDAFADQIGVLRRRTGREDGALLDRLEAVRSRLATLEISGGGKLSAPARLAEIEKLEAENEQIETAIGKRSAEFRVQAQGVDVEAVRNALPAGTALVEFVLFRALDFQRRGTTGEHYAAYVLLPESAKPLLVSLGDAATIDAQIQRWRVALSSPRNSDVKDLGRLLDEKVMRPVRSLLGTARHVFVSPDGALNLIPFAALVDQNNHYLVDNYSFTYLTSGRDLLRPPSLDRTHDEVVIVANPLFDLTATPHANGFAPATNKPVRQEKRSVDFNLVNYQPLLGTASEAKALNQLWPSATVLTEARATEAALKRVKTPLILHVATHGFFLPNKPEAVAAPAGSQKSAPSSERAGAENPLLRSGLILAGVKQSRSGEEDDGVLTAFEMASLNLSGTKLVVLSACETGIGDVKRGEGLYGLRRALVLAGSESQVISLWKVSDAGTRDLMTAYYTRLQNHQGRTAALRQVQLAMLEGKLTSGRARQSARRETADSDENGATGSYRHPYYWAAFIQSGDWRNMEGR